MKIALLYLTHKNSQCLFNLQTLIKHINSYKEYKIDLYIYNDNEELNDIIYIDNYCEFSYKCLKEKLNYNHKFNDHAEYIGNTHLTTIDLYKTHPEYDKYLFYEDDVYYNGENNMFDLFDFNNDILLIYPRYEVGDWWCWKQKQELHNINLTPYGGLLNIYCFSKDVISKIYNYMLEGNFAHHEYLINSYIMLNYEKYNWSITYLKGSNDFKINKKCFEYIGKDFIHPIKNIEQLFEYKNNLVNNENTI